LVKICEFLGIFFGGEINLFESNKIGLNNGEEFVKVMFVVKNGVGVVK